MLEYAIIVILAIIFVYLAFKYPKARDFIAPKKENLQVSAEEILDAKTYDIPDAILETAAKETEIVDELDAYEPDVAELLKDAREKIADGKFISAEKILIDAIVKDHDCAWAYERLGSVYVLMDKNLDDAKESYETALKIDKSNMLAWFGLGQILFRQAQFNKSINCFQKATMLDRNNPEFYGALGKAYMEVRQFAKAAKALKRASSLDISNAEYKKLASFAEDKHRGHSQAAKMS